LIDELPVVSPVLVIVKLKFVVPELPSFEETSLMLMFGSHASPIPSCPMSSCNGFARN